jgi:hypothetical protein
MRKFKTPLDVDLPTCGHQTVHGPYAAAMLLMISWPTQDDPARDEAERVCLGAFRGAADLDDARDAFLAAAQAFAAPADGLAA